MPKQLLWKIGGAAGFGIMTTGLNFSKIAARSGYNLFDYTEYPSLIRGGHNTYEVLISRELVGSSKKDIDILVCLNKDTFELDKERLTKNSLVVFDGGEFTPEGNYRLVNLPLRSILKEEGSGEIMLNNIALGASLALLNWDLDLLQNIFEDVFAKKGPQVIEENKKLAQRGFNHIKDKYAHLVIKEYLPFKSEEKLILTGNESFSLGAIAANCGLFSAYPMTPASSVLTILASYAEKSGMVVRHAEDEIAVINTAIGSSWAGVRSAVATSGGGFALMVEGVSLAGMMETPIVIFLAQRPGPATGMPTWTEQGDLLFAVHAGHGDFPKIILAPGDVEEVYKLTVKAFDLADIYQTPVIMMSDKYLSESHQSTSLPEFNSHIGSYKPNRGKVIRGIVENVYKRYAISDDGISPMLIPGEKDVFYQSNSYEHSEDGHTTESMQDRIQQADKRNEKLGTYLSRDFQPPNVYGDLDTSEIVFVSWGSNKGPIMEAMKELGEKACLVHFTYIYPLDQRKILPFFSKGKRYVLVENNQTGQFGRLLREQTGIDIEEKLLKYDGKMFKPEEIIKICQ